MNEQERLSETNTIHLFKQFKSELGQNEAYCILGSNHWFMTDRNIMCPLESLLLKYDTPSIFKAKSHLEMSINLVLAFLSKFC